MNDFWQGLSRSARAGLIAGVVLIALLLGAGTWWLMRHDYQVLFSDLKPQDASAMAAELERLKLPYEVSADGGTILVDKAVVHATRLKLMGKDLPLHGAVGLELFNNTDFGMTEFAQKINYQRALQGELTRTILSLSEVRDVRVHLAMPEQGLFKQATSKAKASITLTMRPGQVLRPEQVTGMARLVAAAVPGMTPQEVTIVDNQGVTLTRPNADSETEANSARLDMKRETEDYLSRKAGTVLERLFGPGQALVTVDVVLNLDQVKLTTEEVMPAPGSSKNGATPTGVVVRERVSLRESAGSPDARNQADSSLPAAGGRPAGSTQREIDYQVGRRIEQVVSQPGSIRRIQAVAVVRKSLDLQQEEQLRRMVAAAVGASLDRGDTVVIQTFTGPMAGAVPASPTVPDAYSVKPLVPNVHEVIETESAASKEAVPPVRTARSTEFITLVAMLMLAVAAWGVLALRKQRAHQSSASAASRSLTEAQRQAALEKVRAWMLSSQAGAESPSAVRGGDV